MKPTFPTQDALTSGATESRRGRGANSQRLPVSEAEPVSFAVETKMRTAEVDQTSTPTDRGEEVPKLPHRGLPQGCTIDDVIRFPEEAAAWLGVTVDWIRKRKHTLPGVIAESREVYRFHPRTYLDKRLKKGLR